MESSEDSRDGFWRWLDGLTEEKKALPPAVVVGLFLGEIRLEWFREEQNRKREMGL